MKDSNAITGPRVPTASLETARYARECSVLVKRMKDYADMFAMLHSSVLDWDACQETCNAVAKIHRNYEDCLKRYVLIYHQTVRTKSLQEWQEMRQDALKAANFVLESPPPTDK